MSSKHMPPFCSLRYAQRHPSAVIHNKKGTAAKKTALQSLELTTILARWSLRSQCLLHKSCGNYTAAAQAAAAVHVVMRRRRPTQDRMHKVTAIYTHTSKVPGQLYAHVRNTFVQMIQFIRTLQKYPSPPPKKYAHFVNTLKFMRTLQKYHSNLYAHFGSTEESTIFNLYAHFRSTNVFIRTLQKYHVNIYAHFRNTLRTVAATDAAYRATILCRTIQREKQSKQHPRGEYASVRINKRLLVALYACATGCLAPTAFFLCPLSHACMHP